MMLRVRHRDTMTKQDEISKLRAIERTYQDCPRQLAFCARRKWMFIVTGWFLMFVAGVPVFFGLVSGRLGFAIELFIAVLGGSAIGLAASFSTAAKWIPFLVRHTTLHDEGVRKRLEELKNA